MRGPPVLERIYTRIDVIDYDKDKNIFVKVASIYLLGDAASKVKTEEDINARNKELAAAIGISTINALCPTAAAGGDVSDASDDWEQLGDEDFEELLNTERPTVAKGHAIASTTGGPMRQPLPTGTHISNLVLYSKDKLADIREKIAIETKIDPFKQYLWLQNAHKSLTGDSISLMSHYTTSVRMIEGFPLDVRPTAPYEVQSPLEIFAEHNAIVITCVSLDSIVYDKPKLRFIANSDSELFTTIYSSTIQRFFSMLSYAQFGAYVSNGELDKFNEGEALRRFKSQAKLLASLDRQPQVTLDSSNLITAATTNITLVASFQDQQPRIDTFKLFQMIDTNKLNNVAFIDVYHYDSYQRALRLRKIQQRDRYRRNLSATNLVSMPVSKKQLMLAKCMVIYLLSTVEYSELMLVINQYGTVWIKANPNQTLTFSKVAFIKFITPIVNAIISEINLLESAFNTREPLPKLTPEPKTHNLLSYRILTSSTNLTFKFPVAYSKLLDLIVKQLFETGFVYASTNERLRMHKMTMAFVIHYGVTHNLQSALTQTSEIEIKNINEAASIGLYNLDMAETDLYVDLIGRVVLAAGSSLKLDQSNQSQLGLIDPVLFRPRIAADAYSRICQKKFQPIATKADDKKAIEYYNFTFHRPEYYKCPSRQFSVLGFITNKHEQGYCLPCCRKTQPANVERVRQQCISNVTTNEERTSTYKVDYPLFDIPNSKVMNRRIKLPEYVTQILGAQSLVANGTIMTCHGNIRLCIKPLTKAWLQTATILAAADDGHEEAIFNSHREFILDLIAMLKQPMMHLNIMQNAIIAQHFPTPQALIHALEDLFLKNSIALDSASKVSSVDINDIIVFLANCRGMNVLLLSDDRQSSIEMLNFASINVDRPVIVLLKRMDLEWSLQSRNTRALYLPITTSSFKVLYKSRLLIQRLQLTSGLTKTKRIVSGNAEVLMNKQMSIDQLTKFASSNKQYQLLEDLSDLKLAVLKTGRSELVTSVSTPLATRAIRPIATLPTANLREAIQFVVDYNNYLIVSTAGTKSILDSYKKYLKVALISTSRYELVNLNGFLLKIVQFIVCSGEVIGARVSINDDTKVVATELLFVKPTSTQSASTEIKRALDDQKTAHSRGNAQQILCSPFDQQFTIDSAFVAWDVNPLAAIKLIQEQSCKTDLTGSYNIGMYMNEIYTLLVVNVMHAWKQTRPSALDDDLIRLMRDTASFPILETRIDAFYNDVEQRLQQYDIAIVRSVLTDLFNEINTSVNKSEDGIARVKEFKPLNGFELKNLHKLTHAELRSRVEEFVQKLTVQTSTYPTFDLTRSVMDQYKKFYDGDKRLMLHTSVHRELIELLVADLANPFRRDYIINMQLTLPTLEDIRPHAGEVIYVS